MYNLAEIRKTFPAAVFILTLLFSALAGEHLVKLGVANPFYEERWVDPPIISIHSPANGSYVNNVLLNFTVTKPEWWVNAPGRLGYAQELQSVSYEVDGKFNGSVDVNSNSTSLGSVSYEINGKFFVSLGLNSNLSSPFNYLAYLSNLTDGVHSLIVHAHATGFVIETHGLWDYYEPINSSSVVYFTLDTTPPSVSVLSLENKTYDAPYAPLNFTVNEPVLQTSYVLDGQENVPIGGNVTLSDLSYGTHTLIVFATDIAGNVGVSETILFTIAKETEPFPTTLVAAFVASVVAVCVGLLVYFKRRNH
jgi:hypothetical protein